MTRFDSPLPGPFLELSTANLHLNELSVDQLAALWNVFTKVGDSLHKGRRLENFVWRAWHREAHLLPPDASWSDFADCTPLETPALSRAGSISQSLQRKPTINQVMAGCMAASHPDNLPSDPESGVDWSDESDDEEEGDQQDETHGATADSRISQRHQASPQSTRAAWIASNQSRHASGSRDRGRSKTGRDLVGVPPSNLTSPPPSTIPETRQLAIATPPRTATTSALPLDHIAAEYKDRRRAASSSSAFGSRARVRHLNLRKTTRRRPISFQAALESLTSGNDSDDLACLARDHQKRGLGAAHERRSFQGPVPLDITKTESIETDDTVAASHSSAPAASTFDLGHTAPPMSPPAVASQTEPLPPSEEERKRDDAQPAQSSKERATTSEPARLPQSNSAQEMPPPSIPIQPKPAAAAYKDKAPDALKQAKAAEASAAVDGQASKSGRKAKFFLSSSVGKSYEDEDEEEVAQTATAPAAETKAKASDASASALSRQHVDVPAPPAAVQPKASKSKNDVKTSALSSANRNKSGASLTKGKGRAGAGRQGSSGRLAAAGLAMTKAQVSHAPAPSALTKPPAKPAVAGNKGRRPSRPVKFIMGGDDDDDEDFTDEEEEEIPVQKVPPKKALSPPRQQAPAVVVDKKAPVEAEVVDDDDDDAWSSDTSAEAEEERQRREAEIRRRRLEEEERQRNLFKKVPIRSASAADVRLIEQQSAAAPPNAHTHSHSPPQAQGSQNSGPVRGLLSSLFHPQQEPHPPPGQLHGRPHASAADLRAKPERPPSRAGESKSERRHRPPSLIGDTPSGEHGGSLKMSKSAVALPVLNTAQPKVTGGGHVAVPDSDAEDDLEDVRQAEGLGPSGASGSAGSRQSSKRLGYKRAMSSQQTVTQSPDSAHTVRRFGSGGSQGSSRSRERPPIPEPLAAPNLAPHRAATALPAPAAAQTPRTTRRNMLRDELSESLRQNLLWERQSRNRMLGIGAKAPRATTTPPVAHNQQGPQATASSSGTARQQQQPLQQQTAPPPRHLRRETVLGGNQLRPLTQGVSGSHGQFQHGSASHATTSTSAAAAAGTTYHHHGQGQMPPPPPPSQQQQQQQQRGGGPPLHRHHTQQQQPHHPQAHHHHSRSTPHLSAAMSSPSLQRSQSGSGGPSAVSGGNANHGRRLAFDVDSTDDSELSDARDSLDDDGPLPPGAVIGGGGPAAALGNTGAGAGAGAGHLHDPGGTRHRSREREREQEKVKKRVLYPGGFPNYHQHGW